MEDKSISIIIPIYNAESTLKDVLIVLLSNHISNGH